MEKLTPQQIVEVGSMLASLGTYMSRTVINLGGGMGQDGEFGHIIQLLNGVRGTYVDIGAGDAVSCSNTWQLYSLGWSGILLEPHPANWYGILRNRPRDRLIPIAVSDRTGISRMRISGPCSSMRPDWEINPQAELFVETDTLANILMIYPEIRASCRLCSIDVEGWERQVLDGIDWNTFHPDVFVVEYVKFNADNIGEDISAEWEPLLLSKGYQRFSQTTFNYIYGTPEAVARATT